MPKAVAIVEEYCLDVLKSEALIIRNMSGNTKSVRIAEKCGYRYHSKKKNGTDYKVNYKKYTIQ